MNVEAAAAILVATHGSVKAHRQALLEQQNARRARSRKRFSFWLGVESEVKKLASNSGDDEAAEPTPKTRLN
jgi:hypothetical protein